MNQECSRLQEEEAIRWTAGHQAGPHSVESIGQSRRVEEEGEMGRALRKGVIFILSAAASRRMVLRVGEKSELLCILLWTQPPILGVHEKESVT